MYSKCALPSIWDPIENVQQKRTSCRFPHIVDTFSCKHIGNLCATIFGDSGLRCKWWWKRCEYQKRGTVHIEVFICLDCDTYIIKSTEIALKACMEEFSIDKNGG